MFTEGGGELLTLDKHPGFISTFPNINDSDHHDVSKVALMPHHHHRFRSRSFALFVESFRDKVNIGQK